MWPEYSASAERGVRHMTHDSLSHHDNLFAWGIWDRSAKPGRRNVQKSKLSIVGYTRGMCRWLFAKDDARFERARGGLSDEEGTTQENHTPVCV